MTNLINNSDKLNEIYFRNANVNFGFKQLYKRIKNISKFYTKVFNSILFVRLLSIDKIPLSQNYNYTLKFKQSNPDLFNKLLYIINNLPKEYADIISRINNLKIIDVLKFYTEQYKYYCGKIIDSINYISTSGFSNLLYEYNKTFKNHNKCTNGKFQIQFLNDFKYLIINQLSKQEKAMEEYLTRNNNIKPKTIEDLHNMIDK